MARYSALAGLALLGFCSRASAQGCGDLECDALYPLWLNLDQFNNGLDSYCVVDPNDGAFLEIEVMIW